MQPSPPTVRPYERPLRPPWWARGGHAQTILSHFAPMAAPEIGTPADRRLEVELEDGDRLVGFAREGSGPRRGTRVHLFHGLSGDANADYMRRIAAGLVADGHDIWALNHRGCGAGAGMAEGIYHSGRSEDMAAVLAASHAEAPGLTHLVVGFSLSGNIGLQLLAEARTPLPAGVISINPPADLEATSRRIQTGLSQLYERRFVRRLRRAVVSRARERDEVPPHIPRGSSLWDLDELVTAPRGGFADARDYYARCSTLGRLGEITRPAVILTARDDPFVAAEMFEDAPRPAHVHLHVEETGGHVGYLEARGLGYGCWLTGAVVHYVAELARLAEPGA